jgi:hypothetical protein
MERLPKRVNDLLNGKFKFLGIDPVIIDEIFEEHQLVEKKIEISTVQHKKGLYRSIQELLFSEEDSDFKKLNLIGELQTLLPPRLGNVERISALVCIRGVLEYFYANPHILEIGVAKDDAAIAAADLKRQRKADRLRKQIKVAS